MKTPITIVALFMLCTWANAQTEPTTDESVDSLKQQVESLRKDAKRAKNDIAYLSSQIADLKELISSEGIRIENLQNSIEENQNSISVKANELGSQIKETEDKASKGIAQLGNSLSQNTLYWIIAFLATALLSGLVYFLLKKRISNDKSELDQQIIDTKKSLVEEGIKLDNKLIDVLDTQLKLMSQEKPLANTGNSDEDHSLALKVADEITRIQMNLNHMDPGTKGLKQLSRAVNAIVDNFQANGYEIPELLNKAYDQGMNLVATMEPDENLESGKQIIKRIIKPQINYKGEIIQTAQVVIAFGE